METEKQKRYIDLHTHTNYSDGLYATPAQNVMLAALKGTNVFAITDHDNTLGYNEGKAEADRLGITFLPGVEITTPKYHLLGLNFDPNNRVLLDFLEYSKNIQRERCKQRVEVLREYGFPFTFQEIINTFPNSRLAKYNIFATMLLNPECRKIMEREYPGISPLKRFRKYFGRKGPVGSLPDEGVDPSEAILSVHSAGGLIGIAHPTKNVDNMSEMDILLMQGIDFLEVQPNFRGKENARYKTEDFEEFAKNNFLPITYGSDYHGPTFDRPLLEMGENILHPDLEEMLNRGYVKIPSGRLEEVCC